MDVSTRREFVDGSGCGFKIKAAALCTYAIYLSQMVSHLRLNPDVVVYLGMAASAAEGKGFLHQGSHTHYPIGYPLILLLLERAGIGTPWAIVGLNCLFVAVGLAAGFEVLRRGLGLNSRDAGAICCLTLLSSVIINNIFMPMSDAVFMGLSMTSVLTMLWAQRQEGGRKWLGVAGAALLIAMSLLVRMIGVALVPALILVCLPRGVTPGSLLSAATSSGARRLALAIVTCVVIAGGVLLITRTMYFQGALRVHSEWGAQAGITILNYRAKDWAELVANMRVVTLPTPVRIALKFVGLLAFAAALLSLWVRRHLFGVAEVYVSSVTLVLLAWPYTDGRQWIPILPLLMGLLLLLFRRAARRAPRLKYAAGVYLLWFVLAGVAALALNTRDSLSEPHYENLDPETMSLVRRFSQ